MKHHRNTYDFVKYSGIIKFAATKLYFDPGHQCQFTRRMRTVKFVKKPHKGIGVVGKHFIGVADLQL